MPAQCSGPSRPLYVVSPSTVIFTGTSTLSMRITVPYSGCVTSLHRRAKVAWRVGLQARCGKERRSVHPSAPARLCSGRSGA